MIDASPKGHCTQVEHLDTVKDVQGLAAIFNAEVTPSKPVSFAKSSCEVFHEGWPLSANSNAGMAFVKGLTVG